MATETGSPALGVARGPPASVPGREGLTLAERFVAGFRLPYVLGCVFVGLVLFGVFTTGLSAYVETADLQQALEAAFAPESVAVGLLVSYAFYAPRYMRERLADAGAHLFALLPSREDGFRKVFSGIASARPQLVTWMLFLVSLLLAVNVSALMGAAPSSIVIAGGTPSPLEFFAAVYGVVSLAVATLGLSSVVWTYSTISRGIHRFGGTPLSLRPYYEDSFLGLKPVGSLSLSLAGAYFGFIVLLLLVLATSPRVPTVGDVIGVGGFVSGLIVVGLVLFFIPMRRLHRQMIERKRLEVGRLRERLAPIFYDRAEATAPKDIGHLFHLDMMDRKVSSMALWPFDMRILGKLSVIALSVTAILISRIVAIILRI